MQPPVALTIAGSDSGGAAGIQADLKTFAALSVYGASAITAVTAQNTLGVKSVSVLGPTMVADQIACVLADAPVAAVKTGMLATAEIVSTVVASLHGRGLPLVVDPVMVATSGARLCDLDALEAYRTELLPAATVVTPNVDELALLLGCDPASITSVAALQDAAASLAATYEVVVVAKGGHLDPVGSTVTDVVATQTSTIALEQPFVATSNTHGTGCTFSAAIAALLAAGSPLDHAIARAQRYVHQAISGGATWKLGQGHGPLDHFGWATQEATSPW